MRLLVSQAPTSSVRALASLGLGSLCCGLIGSTTVISMLSSGLPGPGTPTQALIPASGPCPPACPAHLRNPGEHRAGAAQEKQH